MKGVGRPTEQTLILILANGQNLFIKVGVLLPKYKNSYSFDVYRISKTILWLNEEN